MKILVADDDPVSRTLMVAILDSSQLGYEVSAVSDGTAAWDAMTATPDFKLAILDLSMPGLNGMELIDRMHGDPRLAGIPIIICTSSSDRATVAAAASRGVGHFLVKPFARTTVLDKVRQVCRPTTAGLPVLKDLSAARERFEVDRDAHRELLEQYLRMADLWASSAQRATEFPRVRALTVLAGHFAAMFADLGAPAVAAKFREAEHALVKYRHKPLQNEEAACFRQVRSGAEQVQREVDRLREGLQTVG